MSGFEFALVAAALGLLALSRVAFALADRAPAPPALPRGAHVDAEWAIWTNSQHPEVRIRETYRYLAFELDHSLTWEWPPREVGA
jgi:hypothetical protein